MLAGGCFWGMEAVFEHVKGVKDVVSGYAGGAPKDANYDAVSSERTRHAEAVDHLRPEPGQLRPAAPGLFRGRPRPDGGQSPGARRRPELSLGDLSADRGSGAGRPSLHRAAASGAFKKPIATKIEPGRFYPAEAYHQDFARKNPYHPYILVHDRPKVAALKSKYPRLWRA